MDGKTKFIIRRSGVSFEYDIHIIREEANELFVARPLTWFTADRSRHISQTTTVTKPTLQQMMDELWDCGIRPSEGSGSAGALAAVQVHLSDMRKIAFKNLKMNWRDLK